MKYKVIGWTYYENEEIPYAQTSLTYAQRHAIVDEIKKRRYLFSGWHHQESWENAVPILNDGKMHVFSQRGWGSVMAEAYGFFGDYDYARFTFYQSIDGDKLKFARKEYDVDDFVSKPIENEHFEVEVNAGLFEIAKKKNPFYLEDLDTLRYIDQNDKITLRCQDEELTFLVADIDRNKKEVKFSKSHLIEGKYKIIVTHKPFGKKIYPLSPLLIVKWKVEDTFKECLKQYDFNTLLNLFLSYDLDFVTNKSKSQKTLKTLKRFAKEYSQYEYDLKLLNNLLRYINDFDLYEEIAVEDNDLLYSFAIYYFDKGVNVDKHIFRLINTSCNSKYFSSKMLLRAIELKPNNKTLRQKYYRISRFSNLDGLAIMFGGSLYDKLNKEDRYLVELNDYKKLKSNDVFKIVEFLSYPNEAVVTDERYAYRAPSIYTYKEPLFIEGILKYQKDMQEKYDVYNHLEEILIHGIKKRMTMIEKEYDGYENNAAYIYALDALTKFKYNLRLKITKEYQNLYPELIEELKDRYDE